MDYGLKIFAVGQKAGKMAKVSILFEDLMSI
jgi:hypothetical protein